MPRVISVDRRRNGIVDLSVRRRAGVKGFQFKASSNWDGAFTLFESVPNHGFKSATCPEAAYGYGRYDHVVRFLFNPTDYTVGVPAVRDDTPFYILAAPINDDGSVGPNEAIHVILPYNSAPNRSFVMAGTAPSGANLAASIEVQLPQNCNDFDISNDGAANLYVAFERPGAEYLVQPTSTAFKSFEQAFTNVNQVFLRGAGGSTTVSIAFTIRNNPL